MSYRNEIYSDTSDLLRGLAQAPRIPLAARAQIAYAAGVLRVASAEDEFTMAVEGSGRSLPVQQLREALGEDNSVDDATVVARTISLLGKMTADMSEVLIRVDSALKEHEVQVGTDCPVCHVTAPCPTRTALEG